MAVHFKKKKEGMLLLASFYTFEKKRSQKLFYIHENDYILHLYDI